MDGCCILYKDDKYLIIIFKSLSIIFNIIYYVVNPSI